MAILLFLYFYLSKGLIDQACSKYVRLSKVHFLIGLLKQKHHKITISRKPSPKLLNSNMFGNPIARFLNSGQFDIIQFDVQIMEAFFVDFNLLFL